MLKFFLVSILIFMSGYAFAQTPYGTCEKPAQFYQERYEANGQTQDMVCMQKAMERDLNDTSSYTCTKSAQHYQTQYEQSGRFTDLVCMQKQLEKELQ